MNFDFPVSAGHKGLCFLIFKSILQGEIIKVLELMGKFGPRIHSRENFKPPKYTTLSPLHESGTVSLTDSLSDQ